MRFLSGVSAGDWSGWRALRRRDPGSTVFGDPAFAEAVARHLDARCRVAAAFRDDPEVPEAGILLFERPRGPFRTVDLPPFLPYTPVATAGSLRATDVHHQRTALEAICPLLTETYGAIRLQLPPGFEDVRLFQWAGWDAEPLYTYRVELGRPDGGIDAWSGSTRRLYENARGDYVLETDAETAPQVLELVEASYRRHGRTLPRPGLPALQRLVEALCTEGLVRIAAAREERTGTPAAGCVLVTGGETDYYWLAGSRPGPAMTVLLGALLRGELPVQPSAGRASSSSGGPADDEKGVRPSDRSTEGDPRDAEHATERPARTLDLVGANTPSIAEFKRKFGGRLTTYYRVETRPSLLLEALARLRGRSSPSSR